MIDLESFGSQVKSRRKRLHLTQCELSKISEINQSHISAIEKGRRKNLQYETVVKLESALTRLETERSEKGAA